MGASRAEEVDSADAARRARFETSVIVHKPALDAVARKLCRGAAPAADLVQDTLERAWRSFDSLQDAARARAWLVRIMRNTWLDQLRRPHLNVVAIDDSGEPPAELRDEPSPWERVTLDDVRLAIEQLDEPFRTVAVLHDIDGLSYDQIGARLGIRYATAATRLHRAHARIRGLLRGKLDGGTGGSPP